MNKGNFLSEFEHIYHLYFPRLTYFAKVYVLSKEDAENIVQDVFTELWAKKERLTIYSNLTAFLFTATKNHCLNFLRHQIIVQESAISIQEEYRLSLQASLNSLQALDESVFSRKDLETAINQAINSLPEKCRQIFIMSKLEEKKQKEIANELHISVNTVETQIGIAYKHLRKELKHFITLFISLFF